MIYPVTDLSSFATSSYQEFAEDHYLTKKEMEWFRGCYLQSMDDARHPHASPLLANRISPGCRRLSSSPPNATRCATKAKPTPNAWRTPECR